MKIAEKVSPFWLAAAVCLGGTASPAQWQPFADWLLVDGSIVTVDEDFAIHEAMAVKDGRIIAVGSTADQRRRRRRPSPHASGETSLRDC